MNVERISVEEARRRFSPGSPAQAVALGFDEVGTFSREQWDALGAWVNWDAFLGRRYDDPRYEYWVLACLTRRLSILADQTFRHSPDRRAEIIRIMRGASAASQMLENHTA